MKVILFITLSIFSIFVYGCSNIIKEDTTDNIYLIPEGFEGSITVFYDVPGEPQLKKEGKYTVIPIEALAFNVFGDPQMDTYGAFFTSTSDMKYGTVNDKYFYVDEKGKRTPIKEECASVGGNGSYTGDSGEEIVFSNLQVTKSHCGESFRSEGHESYHIQQKEVMNFWLSHFD
ncbi:hypothetical protein AWM68_17620 [Fictibacillus phosphorivorans]|uniref:DUF6843 domain-containing protein n=1 Tax=Fictibacillus phosphorivorans TaxID=1221500 RepID=A0A161TPN0_9BACL|nr:hypothetical protein [Fictibacillus phosphorivorans]KZE67991.1 hypothetical protein AWM68_17620 [Fictibacillus phosphorivorans]